MRNITLGLVALVWSLGRRRSKWAGVLADLPAARQVPVSHRAGGSDSRCQQRFIVRGQCHFEYQIRVFQRNRILASAHIPYLNPVVVGNHNMRTISKHGEGIACDFFEDQRRAIRKNTEQLFRFGRRATWLRNA